MCAQDVPHAQGKFVPDEEELTPRPKGALQSSKVTLATPGKFFGISGLGFTKCVTPHPLLPYPSKARVPSTWCPCSLYRCHWCMSLQEQCATLPVELV